MLPMQTFQGAQLTPHDAGYDEARAVFNGMIDRRPALIAQCAGPGDVAAALAYADRERLRVAVRAGGHSVAGLSMIDGGVVIDVRPMNAVEVDPVARVAKVGAGATMAELDAACQAHGLATTGGRVSSTGVAGFTLGGGSGWLERSYGLACDNLLAADLVLADGTRVRASETENPGLLWALRGAGQNFGVVTSLELKLYDVGPLLYGGLAAFDPADGRGLVRAFRDFHRPGADQAGLAIVYLYGPPEEFVPPEWQGRLMVGVAGCWNGPTAEGRAALSGLLGSAEPIFDLFGELPYVGLQQMIDDPPGLRNWWTGEYLDELTDDAIEAYCAYSEAMPAGSQSILFPWGGAVARNAGSGPMARREARWVMHPFCLWEDPRQDVKQISWGKRCREVFAPYRSGGVYLNFIGDEGPERVRAAFGPDYDRLRMLKRRFDPGNVFAGNQNIPPAG